MPRRLSTALAALAITIPLGLAGNAMAGDDAKDRSDRSDAASQSDDKKQAPASPSTRGQESRPKGGGGANSDCGAYCPTPDEGRQGNGKAPQNGTVGKADSKNPPGQRPDGSDGNRGYECDRNPGVGDGNPAHTGCAQTAPATAPAKPGKPSKPSRPSKPSEPAEPAAPAKPVAPVKPGKTTICHATGSAKNPYVIITVAESALAAHRVHQHGRDMIPAPAEGCPGPGLLSTPDEQAPGILGATDKAPMTGAPADGRIPSVLGAFAEGGPDSDAPATDGRRESGADSPAASGRLPFTGLGLGLIVALGLGAVLAGLALQRTAGRDSA